MNWFANKGFARGIQPPSHKDATARLPIRQFPFAPELSLPMQQHIGKPARCQVRVEQDVSRGEVIAVADGDMSVPIHAPASGTITRIGLVPTVAGQPTMGVVLRPFPASTQEVVAGIPCDINNATSHDILHAIQNAGIVGLGGAAFPTHVKLRVPEQHVIDTLIINGCECEPYLTTDHRVMLEQAADIMLGIRYVQKASGAARTIIAIEANKTDAADVLQKLLPDDLPICIEILSVMYPQGAEKILIKTLLGREVPAGGHAYHVGVVTVNVATVAEIGRLLPMGRGICERVITVAGGAIQKPGNYRIPIGTPLRFILDYVGASAETQRIFLGGPMMGSAVANVDAAVTKGTLGVIAFTGVECGASLREYPCIHCGACVDACPMRLNPAQLGKLAQKQRYAEMAESYGLRECFECGCCSYVCPSHIPLTHYFRAAKTTLATTRATP